MMAAQYGLFTITVTSESLIEPAQMKHLPILRRQSAQTQHAAATGDPLVQKDQLSDEAAAQYLDLVQLQDQPLHEVLLEQSP